MLPNAGGPGQGRWLHTGKALKALSPQQKPGRAAVWCPGSGFWLKDHAGQTPTTLLLYLMEKMTEVWFLVQQMEGVVFSAGIFMLWLQLRHSHSLDSCKVLF